MASPLTRQCLLVSKALPNVCARLKAYRVGNSRSRFAPCVGPAHAHRYLDTSHTYVDTQAHTCAVL